MTGTNDLSEEKHCDHSEEDNYNYYYQEFVKKGSKISKLVLKIFQVVKE